MTNKLYIAIIAFVLFFTVDATAQTSAFVFQGKLNDGSLAANGSYQFTFTLHDAASGGNQIGQTITDLSATVTNGIFAVNLDFGANSFDGAARFIEVGVRMSGTGQNYTILNPRQAVTSTPYAVKSLKSDEAVTANNSQNLGGVAANQYVQTNDSRMSNDRNPLAGSSNYIQNGTTAQASSNFNISGEGKANIFSANTQFNIGGNRIFHLTGAFNTFVGFESGNAISGGTSNSFFGIFAGKNTTGGSNNSFFGSYAGRDNDTGSENSFFGQGAGLKNTLGAGNSLFGYGAGLNNTTGTNNTFVGFVAGQSNTTEEYNTFIGYRANGTAGITNATAIGANSVVTTSNTMVLGTDVITVKVPGNFTVANTFSANALDSATVYKIAGNRVFHLTGTDNTFVGFESGNSVTIGGFNAFYGTFAGKNTTTGNANSFFGSYAGRGNSTGIGNSFFGANAGLSSNGSFNAFFGSGSGISNINGANNSYFGYATGANNSSGDNNSFFGSNSGKSVNNSAYNSFFGSFSGEKTTTGVGNTFIGTFAGRENIIGFNNTFIGYKAAQTPTTGNGNVVIGYNSSMANGVSNSIAIGQNVQINLSNTIIIGNSNTQNTYLSGNLFTGDINGSNISGNTISGGSGNFGNISADKITIDPITAYEPSTFVNAEFKNIKTDEITIKNTTVNAGSIPLCLGGGMPPFGSFYKVVICASSLRYKDNVQNFTGGLELLKQLRPVTFNWKSGGAADVGFIAEEVNRAEPLLTTSNEKGEVQSVKYAQVTTVLVNAVKEQQEQIEKQNEQIKEQQAQIEALKELVCAGNQTAAVCRQKK